jgi:threonine/homoserine/homoserine lactone efflux protein
MSQTLQLLPYAGVVVLGAMAPGPDFAIVTRFSALGGRRFGISAAAGVAAGMAVNTAAALAGMGALLAASPTLYRWVKLIGAAYLIYIGVQALLSLRAKNAAAELEMLEDEEGRTGLLLAFRQGLLTNFLNPKVVVFLVTLMPQFLPDRPSALQQLALGVVSVVMVFLWFGTVALTVSALRRFFRRPNVRKALNGITGVVLLAVGARIALA